MTEFGNYLIPCVIGLILVFGLVRRVPLFDTFLEGAKEGAKSTFGIIPALVGLITAVSMLKASGALDMFTAFIAPLAEKIGLPPQVVPLMLLRPVSGSGSLALVDQIFSSSGVDSFAGRVAAVMMGSTETMAALGAATSPRRFAAGDTPNRLTCPFRASRSAGSRS